MKDIYKTLDNKLTKLEKYLNKKLKKIKKDYFYLIKPFLILFGIYCFSYLSIFKSNFNYNDDIGRVIYGYRGWDNFSRYISNFFSIFIHGDRYVTDVSPLPQIIGILFLSLSGIILIKLFKKDKKITFFNLLSVSLIGLCPYFLECISYKFDAPYMAFSILISFVPFLFYKNEKKKLIIYSVITILCTILMCTSYQVSSCVIPLVTVFLGYKIYKDENFNNAIKFIFITAISYIFGLVIFRLFIMKSVETYVSTSLLSLNEFIPGMIKNFGNYYLFLIKDFRKFWVYYSLYFLFLLKFLGVRVAS